MFCQLDGHEYYVQVEEGFVENGFNLTGLQTSVPHFNEALDIIRDMASGILKNCCLI